MVAIGRNNPCPCGSGKKYKKCCLNKKPREHVITVASPERLHGFHYDKETMELTGLTLDNRLIKLDTTYSQTHYMSDSGKEKVIARIQDKVIPNETELMRHLSSTFDLIIALDTNTKIIGSKRISATGILHCSLKYGSEPDTYDVDFPWQRIRLFRDCPSQLPAEKFGWLAEIQRINREPRSKLIRFAIVTDHDLDNQTLYNVKKMPIFKDFYLPDNFTFIYGRADTSNETLLNYLVKKCDKESTSVIRMIEEIGYYQDGETKYSIEQIPPVSL
ncbi:MAG: SEC-C metal-binding domain-containing protein [Smithellaceae bacterium]|jgi:hypothetical protein